MIRRLLAQCGVPPIAARVAFPAHAAAGRVAPTHTHAPPAHAPVSFIERTKVLGANAMLGLFNMTNRFDSSLEGLEVTRVDTAGGAVHATLRVTERVANGYGTLHGGAAATIVDVVGTMALLALDPLRPGVSVEINVSFVAAAKLGETVHVVGRTLRTGKRLGFTQVDITRASDGALIATGRHTKAL